MAVNPQWLELVQEAVIDPQQRIVDAHHHLWPLLGGPPRSAAYLAPDYGADLASGHRVEASVFVQCRSCYRETGPVQLRPVGETEWVNGLAESAAAVPGGPRIAAGIVGHTDLRLDAVEEVLQAHLAAAPRRFRGIRQSSNWTDDGAAFRPTTVLTVSVPPHLLMDAAFRRGFACLAPLGLSFDCWLYHPQLPELTDLAQAFPDTTIILNHFGGLLGNGRFAADRATQFALWRRDIAELARCPNVYLKLGGTVMKVFGEDWAARQRPPGSDDLVRASAHLYHAAIESFTPARCMFESNFPVDKESCSWVVLWNSFKKIAAGYSAAERADLFAGTARRAYRLGEA